MRSTNAKKRVVTPWNEAVKGGVLTREGFFTVDSNAIG